MSQPRPPAPAKPIVGFFVKDKALAAQIARDLQNQLGPVEMASPWLDFDFTTYYAKEMGGPLFRRMLVFKTLIRQSRLAEIKCMTNDLEAVYLDRGQRRVNIDPGYLVAERLVLASGKNFTHRIYIGRQIYADLTLIFQKGAFRSLPWTYPDYADRRMIDFLTLVRRRYMNQLKQAAQERQR